MILDYLKAGLIYILPHHLISRGVYFLTRLEGRLVAPAIRLFSRVFKVNLAEAANPDPASYQTFNAFFTRALKADARPIAAQDNNAVFVSPVDGAISQVGAIKEGRIFQAKGHEYSALELLGGNEGHAKPFMNGQFITIYLSPRDYHRIHMPIAGKLTDQVYVPGRLYSVAGHTVRTVPRIFARNERVVALFDTEFGKMAMVLVGAINVAAIETVWDGLITPPNGKSITVKDYQDKLIELAKGEEMGRFNMGSTVVLLMEKGDMQWDRDCVADRPVKLGESLAKM